MPKQKSLGQHRTMGAAGFSRSFVPIVQYEKWEIHPVFPHFPYFRLGQNLSPNLLATLCGVALAQLEAERAACEQQLAQLQHKVQQYENRILRQENTPAGKQEKNT